MSESLTLLRDHTILDYACILLHHCYCHHRIGYRLQCVRQFTFVCSCVSVCAYQPVQTVHARACVCVCVSRKWSNYNQNHLISMWHHTYAWCVIHRISIQLICVAVFVLSCVDMFSHHTGRNMCEWHLTKSKTKSRIVLIRQVFRYAFCCFPFSYRPIKSLSMFLWVFSWFPRFGWILSHKTVLMVWGNFSW